MRGMQAEQRRSVRIFITAPVVIDTGRIRHVGLVRDLSGSGIFIFSDFEPKTGTLLNLSLTLPTETSDKVTMVYQGKVVRVEAGTSGAATGIAVEFESNPPKEKASRAA